MESDGPLTASAVVLAAGMGTRMRSERAKVLHELCGRPMITHLLRALEWAGVERLVVVIGPGMETSKRLIRSSVHIPVSFALQRERLGTGHAVRQAEALLTGEQRPILVTYGDTVLYRAETLRTLLRGHAETQAAATVLTTEVADPTGYGRVVRDAAGRVLRVVEEKDATSTERNIREINTGTYVFEPAALWESLALVTPDNAQREYYLTDVIARLNEAGERVAAARCEDPDEARGINDRRQLAEAEAVLRERARRHWLSEGVTLVDPTSISIDPYVTIGADTTIEPFTILQGETQIGSRCRIGPRSRLKDAKVGDGAEVVGADVRRFRVGEGARIGPHAVLGLDEKPSDDER